LVTRSTTALLGDVISLINRTSLASMTSPSRSVAATTRSGMTMRLAASRTLTVSMQRAPAAWAAGRRAVRRSPEIS
jgi:hypothetical protein